MLERRELVFEFAAPDALPTRTITKRIAALRHALALNGKEIGLIKRESPGN